LRAIGRGVAFIAVLVAAALTAPLLCLAATPARSSWLQVAAGAILAASGVQVRIDGPRNFGDSGVLVVANHLSCIEVLAIASVQPVCSPPNARCGVCS
jgi:1-acyl-sn-glycerol-3-phosphate acyltransferase